MGEVNRSISKLDLDLDVDEDQDLDIGQEVLQFKWHEMVSINDNQSFSSESERQQRRRHMEWALRRLMPWNDARFSRLNVRARRPFECRNAEDWVRMLSGNLGATARVCIGTATFWCNPVLLQLHSNYFLRELRVVSRFREGADLCAVGFRAAYDWMRLKEPLHAESPPEKVVELLHTALQLEMSSLEAMCNRYLCSSRFRERDAFDVYWRARSFVMLQPQRQLMLQRIGFHFLAMVGTYKYLEMPLEDVIAVLHQDSLGVNSEVEVLYSAFRWMSSRPRERAPKIRRLMECVRFTRLPLVTLRQMWRGVRRGRCPWNFEEGRARDPRSSDRGDYLMAAFRRDLEIQRRLSDAILVVYLRRFYTERREFMAACRTKGLAVEAPREWLYDEECAYHTRYPKFPYAHNISGNDFMNYTAERARRAREEPRVRSILPVVEKKEEEEQAPNEDQEKDKEREIEKEKEKEEIEVREQEPSTSERQEKEHKEDTEDRVRFTLDRVNLNEIITSSEEEDEPWLPDNFSISNSPRNNNPNQTDSQIPTSSRYLSQNQNQVHWQDPPSGRDAPPPEPRSMYHHWFRRPSYRHSQAPRLPYSPEMRRVAEEMQMELNQQAHRQQLQMAAAREAWMQQEQLEQREQMENNGNGNRNNINNNGNDDEDDEEEEALDEDDDDDEDEGDDDKDEANAGGCTKGFLKGICEYCYADDLQRLSQDKSNLYLEVVEEEDEVEGELVVPLQAFVLESQLVISKLLDEINEEPDSKT
ncbi:hypothetical protein KR009_010610 [Drosophila setifemur]|nr:hypothetical protein KR009_010610 [Drosophila setifemur]